MKPAYMNLFESEVQSISQNKAKSPSRLSNRKKIQPKHFQSVSNSIPLPKSDIKVDADRVKDVTKYVGFLSPNSREIDAFSESRVTGHLHVLVRRNM